MRKGNRQVAKRPNEQIDTGVLSYLIPRVICEFDRSSFETSPFTDGDRVLLKYAGGHPIRLLVLTMRGCV